MLSWRSASSKFAQVRHAPFCAVGAHVLPLFLSTGSLAKRQPVGVAASRARVPSPLPSPFTALHCFPSEWGRRKASGVINALALPVCQPHTAERFHPLPPRCKRTAVGGTMAAAAASLGARFGWAAPFCDRLLRGVSNSTTIHYTMGMLQACWQAGEHGAAGSLVGLWAGSAAASLPASDCPPANLAACLPACLLVCLPPASLGLFHGCPGSGQQPDQLLTGQGILASVQFLSKLHQRARQQGRSCSPTSR